MRSQSPKLNDRVRLWVYDTQYKDGFNLIGTVSKVSPKKGYFTVSGGFVNGWLTWNARFIGIDRDAQISDTLIATYLGVVKESA